MLKKSDDFSSADIKKLLRQPETQALISRLRQLDTAAIEQAAQMAAHGDAKGAQQMLEPLMQDGQVQELTRRLRDQHGGI